MERSIVRRASAVAVAVFIGAGTALVGAGPAAAGSRHASGTYTATFPDTSQTSSLVITNATGSTTSGTFALKDIGDYGTWVSQGTTVAFLVGASSAGRLGAVMIGKLTTTGISPAVIGQQGVGVHPWSATRVSGGPAASAAAAPLGARPFVNPTPGTYHAVFNGTINDTLTMSKDTVAKTEGPFALATLADGGTWAKLGSKVVLGVSSGGDQGIVLLGTQTTTTISSSTAPGAYYQQGQSVHPWYATKV